MYDLSTCNCNHFADAVLKAYGHGGLPGGYFSRGDHIDKQVWNTYSQRVLGLSPADSDRIGKGWCKVRDDTSNGLAKAEKKIRKIVGL